MNSAIFVVTCILLLVWSCAYKHENRCSLELLLKDGHGHNVNCDKFKNPCPIGYFCQNRQCCLVFTTTTMLSTVMCTPPPDCPDGVIVLDDMHCFFCLHPCSSTSCSEGEYCFFKYYQTNNGGYLPYGKCEKNVCSTGQPSSKDNVTEICSGNGKNSDCSEEYTCTIVNPQKGVCCSLPIP